jgi:hypothetical protein
VNAFEAERARLKGNCERRCLQYDIRIADEEYSHAATKMELDNALRLKSLIEAKLISVGDDLEIAEKKSEELETNLKDMEEVIQCLKVESICLRNALENAKTLLEDGLYTVHSAGNEAKNISKSEKNLTSNSSKCKSSRARQQQKQELVQIRSVLLKKEEEIVILKKCVSEKESSEVILKAQLTELNDYVSKHQLPQSLATLRSNKKQKSMSSSCLKNDILVDCDQGKQGKELPFGSVSTAHLDTKQKRNAHKEGENGKRRSPLNHKVIQDENNLSHGLS